MINLGYQSEQQLENLLISNLEEKYNYEKVEIRTEDELEVNFRIQLNKLNITNLKGKELTDKEFERVLIYMKGKSVFQSAKQLRDKFQLQRDNGELVYLLLIDFEKLTRNTFQVTNQVTMRGKYENRYDVTILVNGIPITQIELKRRGLHIKQAFNQICRYARHSYNGLFKYLQILIISNGVDTKYFVNSDRPYRYEMTFFWTDVENKRITNLNDFVREFMNQKHLIEMLDTYTVLNDTDKEMMILRPYQVYAVKSVVKMAKETANGGFVWHSTGSGKTLTSFKASQILAKESSIKKVLFVVDRSDLDTQTTSEFNKFEKDAVDSTDSTNILVKQMKDVSTSLIVTTVQKLSNAVKNPRYEKIMKAYEDEKVIIIMDECHRSQFGDMHTRIRKFFNRAQLFGFTGTPRFKENKSQDGRTTADIFGRCLHSYMIKDAIYDNNVLGFSVEYIETFKGQYDETDGEKVKDIDTQEVYESPERISLVANHILQSHNIKTMRRKYLALFATPSIDVLLKYYGEFKAIDHDLKITAIYTFDSNEDPEGKIKHSREYLDLIIADYNGMFGTNFSTDTYSSYRVDVSKRIKKAEIDIVIVVNMLLTGFDAKPLSVLYVDSPMKYHGLLQAYSRTNRVHEPAKVWGNIVCYRNLKTETDEAIKLFSNSDDVDGVLQKDFTTYVSRFRKQLEHMSSIAERPEDVDELKEESKQKDFVIAFRNMSQTLLALRTFVDFEFKDEIIGISEQDYEDFKSKYLLLYENQQRQSGDKVSILDDIDFGIELLQTDRINVEYIMNLIRTISRDDKKQEEKDVKHIITELGRTDNPKLRKKSELIKKFLMSQLPELPKDENIDDAFNGFEDKERDKEIKKFAEENDIDESLIRNEISEFEFTGAVDKEEISKKIKKPYLIKRSLVGRIVDFINENVFKYE